MPPHKCIITIIIVEFVCQSNKSLASFGDFFLSLSLEMFGKRFRRGNLRISYSYFRKMFSSFALTNLLSVNIYIIVYTAARTYIHAYIYIALNTPTWGLIRRLPSLYADT